MSLPTSSAGKILQHAWEYGPARREKPPSDGHAEGTGTSEWLHSGYDYRRDTMKRFFYMVSGAALLLGVYIGIGVLAWTLDQNEKRALCEGLNGAFKQADPVRGIADKSPKRVGLAELLIPEHQFKLLPGPIRHLTDLLLERLVLSFLRDPLYADLAPSECKLERPAISPLDGEQLRDAVDKAANGIQFGADQKK
jgi:hypothetical protein